MDHLVGAVLDQYEILKPIGSGGMARLYLGVKRGIGGFERFAAIKIVHPKHLDEEEFIRMFLDEARISARLSHPNLVQVYDIGDFDGAPYMVMEYVKGPTLAIVVKRAERKKDVRYAHIASAVAGMCHGLHSAHEASDDKGENLGVIHRDVSTQNVLVAIDGNAKVIDFGVATGKDRLAKTEVGMLKGKLHYMAPEQLHGDDYDCRVDVFASGVTMYRAVLGEFPFQGDNPSELWRARMKGGFKLPSEVKEDFPEDLELIINKSLAGDVEERYQSCAELGAALDDYAAKNSVGATEVAAWLAELFPKGEEEWAGSPVGIGDRTPTSQRLTGYGRAGSTGQLERQSGVTIHAPAGLGKGLLLGLGIMSLLFVGLGLIGLQIYSTSVGTEQVQDEATIHLDGAEILFEEGRYTEALAEVVAAQDTKPAATATKVRLTRLFRKIDRAVKMSLAQMAIDDGQFDDALGPLTELIKKDALDKEARRMYAEVEAARAHASSDAAKKDDELAAEKAAAEAKAKGQDVEKARRAAREKARKRRQAENQRLDALKGTLHLISEPVGSLSINGKFYGTTGTPFKLKANTYTYEVVAEGYKTASGSFTISAKGSKNVSVKLKKLANAPVKDMKAEREAIEEAMRVAEVAKAAAVKKAQADEEARVVAKATAAEAARVAALVPVKQMTDPSLPEKKSVRSIPEVSSVMAAVEGRLIKNGFTAGEVKNVTSPLSAYMASTFSPGQSYMLYPRGTYAFIAQQVDLGSTKNAIGTNLKKAHIRGKLK